MSTKTHCTVRIPRDLRDQVDAVAARQNRSTSDVIRLAIEQFVAGAKRADDSQLRHMSVTEYTQIALDAIIRENHPELRDHLIAQTTFGWNSIMARDDPKGMRRDIRNDGRPIPQEHHSSRGELPRNSGNFTRGSQLLNTQVLMWLQGAKLPILMWLGVFALDREEPC